MPEIIVVDVFGLELLRYEVLDAREGLSRACLAGVHLERAQLARMNLSGAELRWSILFKANLKAANLERAVLRGADLQYADLRGAALSHADLSCDGVLSTSLEGAILRDVDLRAVKLEGATFDASTAFPEGFDPRAAGMRLTGAYARRKRGNHENALRGLCTNDVRNGVYQRAAERRCGQRAR
jgi:uncharacterized protein YjbI with pentapeptide repeats